MRAIYKTPEGAYSKLYKDMLDQVHMLIGGAAGSGKSTVVNGIMHAALYDSPAVRQFVLIDPKGTELDEYRKLPHTIRYAQTMHECVNALQEVMQITKQRFQQMKRQGLRMYNGSDIYVIIDELMYLSNQPCIKKQCMGLLQDILVIARAARVHVIACTQNPTTATIPTTLRCNFDSRLALRTVTAQDSRNILGITGCECFPAPSIEHRALGAYMHSGIIETYSLQQIDDRERQRLIDYWMSKAGKPRYSLFG